MISGNDFMPNLDNDACDEDKANIQTEYSELKAQNAAIKKQLAELQKQNDVMQGQLNTLLVHFGLHLIFYHFLRDDLELDLNNL